MCNASTCKVPQDLEAKRTANTTTLEQLWLPLITALWIMPLLVPICSRTLNFSWREFARARLE